MGIKEEDLTKDVEYHFDHDKQLVFLGQTFKAGIPKPRMLFYCYQCQKVFYVYAEYEQEDIKKEVEKQMKNTQVHTS